MAQTTGTFHAPQRHCPRCTYPITAVGVDGVEVEHCHRCGGTLVEPRAARSQLGPYADPAQWLKHLAQQTTGAKLVCPVDHGTMTGYQVPWGGRSVVIDHCADCGSLWFDRGESRKLYEIVASADADGALSATPQPVDMLTPNELAAHQDFAEKPNLGVYLFQLFTGMPVEVLNPVYGRPFYTRLLVGVIIGVFVLQMAYAIHATDAAYAELFNRFGLVPEALQEGRNLRSVLTHAFMHGGIAHLLGNAYFLWIFGDNVEARVGTKPFLMLYGCSIIAAAALHAFFALDPTVPMVGASGAIAGLMGAYLMLFPRVKVWVVILFMRWRVPVILYLGFWMLLQFGMAHLGVPGVAWWAHIGGFALGLVSGFFLRDLPHPMAQQKPARMPRRRR